MRTTHSILVPSILMVLSLVSANGRAQGARSWCVTGEAISLPAGDPPGVAVFTNEIATNVCGQLGYESCCTGAPFARWSLACIQKGTEYAIQHGIPDVCGRSGWAQGPLPGTGQFYPRDFNLFAATGSSPYQDIQGPTAIGGDYTDTGFNLNSAAPEPVALVVKGNVSLTNGQVHGATYYGQTYSDTQVAYLGASRPSSPNGPIDFAWVSNQLDIMSVNVGNYPGLPGFKASSTLTLEGSDLEMNVFSVTQDDLVGTYSYAINVPQGSSVIINVTGTDPAILYAGFTLGTGVTPNDILWNFPDATTLDLQGVQFPGSILAPHAVANFSGAINGTVVVNSTEANWCEFHWAPFDFPGTGRDLGTLATINIKGPLTLRSKVGWSCSQSSPASVPCPPEFLSEATPRWLAGDGFTVIDANPDPTFPKIYVPKSSVTFRADISYTDDTATAQLPYATAGYYAAPGGGATLGYGPCGAASNSPTDCPANLPVPVRCMQPLNATSNYCVPEECVNKFIPGALEGNSGHYSVTVQKWDNNATSCPGPLPSINPDFPSPAFDTPSPTGASATTGGTGCWVDVATASIDMRPGLDLLADPGEEFQVFTKRAKLQVPIDLTEVSTFVRLLVRLSEFDTRDPVANTAENPVGWSPASGAVTVPGRTSDTLPYGVVPNSDGSFNVLGPLCNDPGEEFMYDWTISSRAPSSYFIYAQALNPFQIVVEPQALAQAKVLPYTLVYQPPGDASKATFMTTTSFGLGMTVDDKLTGNQSNSVSIDNKNIVSDALNLKGSSVKSPPGATTSASGSPLSDLIQNSAIGDALNDSTSWDKSTTVGTGTISDLATNTTTTYQSIITTNVTNPTLTPGAAGAYSNAPFWSDRFVLLVHPQVGFWQLGGQPVVSMLAAAGTPASPVLMEPTVADLDACYRQVDPYANGIPIPNSSGGPSTEFLTKDECYQLLKLDPFYGSGQSLSLANNPRMSFAGGTDYGVDPITSSDLNEIFSQVITASASTTTTTVASYTAKVTDMLVAQTTVGTTLNLYGFTEGVQTQSTETTSSSRDWTVTLQTSYNATAQSSTTITGNFDDHHGLKGDGNFLPAVPHVNVYRDLLFGSFAFQDPAAPAAQ